MKSVIVYGFGWLLVAVVWVLSLMPLTVPTAAVQGGDKLGHFMAYALLTYWFLHLYSYQWWVLIGFILMGIALEILQGLTIYRFFEWADMLANGLGVMVAWFVFSGLKVRIKAAWIRY